MPKTKQHDGHIIARLRKGLNWSQYKLAKDAGIYAPTLRRAEREGNIQLDTARKLCHALGVSLAVFDQQ